MQGIEFLQNIINNICKQNPLIAEVGGFPKNVDVQFTTNIRVLHEWKTFLGQCEQCRMDATRYRWLRMQHWNDSVLAVVCDPKQNVAIGTYCPSDELLDAAIDAALNMPNEPN